jgi:hypothetical protein
VKAPGATLDDLRRFDERLTAHLDGLAVGGDQAWRYCDAGLEEPSQGSLFAATVRALEEREFRRMDRLFSVAKMIPETRAGLLSAFGWL